MNIKLILLFTSFTITSMKQDRFNLIRKYENIISQLIDNNVRIENIDGKINHIEGEICTLRLNELIYQIENFLKESIIKDLNPPEEFMENLNRIKEKIVEKFYYLNESNILKNIENIKKLETFIKTVNMNLVNKNINFKNYLIEKIFKQIIHLSISEYANNEFINNYSIHTNMQKFNNLKNNIKIYERIMFQIDTIDKNPLNIDITSLRDFLEEFAFYPHNEKIYTDSTTYKNNEIFILISKINQILIENLYFSIEINYPNNILVEYMNRMKNITYKIKLKKLVKENNFNFWLTNILRIPEINEDYILLILKKFYTNLFNTHINEEFKLNLNDPVFSNNYKIYIFYFLNYINNNPEVLGLLNSHSKISTLIFNNASSSKERFEIFCIRINFLKENNGFALLEKISQKKYSSNDGLILNKNKCINIADYLKESMLFYLNGEYSHQIIQNIINNINNLEEQNIFEKIINLEVHNSNCILKKIDFQEDINRNHIIINNIELLVQENIYEKIKDLPSSIIFNIKTMISENISNQEIIDIIIQNINILNDKKTFERISDLQFENSVEILKEININIHKNIDIIIKNIELLVETNFKNKIKIFPENIINETADFIMKNINNETKINEVINNIETLEKENFVQNIKDLEFPNLNNVLKRISLIDDISNNPIIQNINLLINQNIIEKIKKFPENIKSDIYDNIHKNIHKTYLINNIITSVETLEKENIFEKIKGDSFLLKENLLEDISYAIYTPKKINQIIKNIDDY